MKGSSLVPSNPSCLDIEDLNAELTNSPSTSPISFLLSRKTGTKFFSDTAIAQLIAHLSRRSGGLEIKDYYQEWLPEHSSRFLTKIDGFAALVYSQLINTVSLANVRNQPAPRDLYERFQAQLAETGLLEQVGPTRTLVAVDPYYSVPTEARSPELSKSELYRIFQRMIKGYERGLQSKTEERIRAENQLINFIYETFQNTVEHGRYSTDRQVLPGLRYLRIHVYVNNDLSGLLKRAGPFPELVRFLRRPRDKRSNTRFLEIAVCDAGQGIASHYLTSIEKEECSHEQRLETLQELVLGRLSSKKHMSGVGLGLPNALSALRELNAFVSLRTEEFWLYSDFDKVGSPGSDLRTLEPVQHLDHCARLTGTQFNVLFDFPW